VSPTLAGVTWEDIDPNLLFGLREGLQAGLVVSLLLAAVRQAAAARADDGRGHDGQGHDGYDRDGRGHDGQGHDGQVRKISAAPVWLGVLGAVMLSGSSAAVLTSSTGTASSRLQGAVSGLLSVFAVGLVTAVIFWMRGAAAGLRAQHRGDPDRVARVTPIGAGALTMTAFLAVGRAGWPTSLSLWAAAHAPGHPAGPLAGTAAGLAAAVVLCWLLRRWAVRLNAGVLFNRAALALLVIAAGALASGLGDLQDAGLLSGRRWIAFDLAAHARPGSWWVSLVTGVTGLTPEMTVLQVVAWIAFLAVGLRAFAKAGRPAAARAGDPAAARHTATGTAGWWQRTAGRRPWTVAVVLVATPALAAAAMIAALPSASSASAAAVTVTVTRNGCAPGWTSADAGSQTFTVDNQSGLPGEINLDDASGDIVAEIETIGPGTSSQLNATLYGGTYVFKCFMGSLPATVSQPVQVAAGHAAAAASPIHGSAVAIKPVTVSELAGPNKEYQAYAARQLADLAQAVTRIQADLHRNDLAAAKQDWLTAQLDWERVGASYDSFGNLGLAVDGLPDGLPDGDSDKNFTGLHRLEYGLWHDQSAATLLPVAATLASNVAAVRQNLASASLAGDPANLPIRTHEILEDALRDHLSGIDDQGGGAAFAETYADVQVTTAVLGYLAPLINARQPGLPDIADNQLSILNAALLATRVNGRWESLGSAAPAAREDVDAAIDAVLETLSAVPDLLEPPPAH
jgi:high-affinity iron transporter